MKASKQTNIKECAFFQYFRLEKKLKDNDDPFNLKVLSASGKIEISLRKTETERWNGIGTPLTGNETWVPQKDFENGDFQKTFRPWRLVSKTQQTPDVSHYVFQPCNKVIDQSK